MYVQNAWQKEVENSNLVLFCLVETLEMCRISKWNLRYSHKGCFALLQAVPFRPRAWFATEAHDEATFVDKVTSDIHSQQQEYKPHNKDPRPQHGAHGERSFIT